MTSGGRSRTGGLGWGHKTTHQTTLGSHPLTDSSPDETRTSLRIGTHSEILSLDRLTTKTSLYLLLCLLLLFGSLLILHTPTPRFLSLRSLSSRPKILSLPFCLSTCLSFSLSSFLSQVSFFSLRFSLTFLSVHSPVGLCRPTIEDSGTRLVAEHTLHLGN